MGEVKIDFPVGDVLSTIFTFLIDTVFIVCPVCRIETVGKVTNVVLLLVFITPLALAIAYLPHRR